MQSRQNQSMLIVESVKCITIFEFRRVLLRAWDRNTVYSELVQQMYCNSMQIKTRTFLKAQFWSDGDFGILPIDFIQVSHSLLNQIRIRRKVVWFARDFRDFLPLQLIFPEQTFLQIINKAYSYFSVLRQFYNWKYGLPFANIFYEKRLSYCLLVFFLNAYARHLTIFSHYKQSNST